MIILAIDTCLGACSAAVVNRESLRGGRGIVLAADRELMATGHAERLFPILQRVLAEARTSVAGCDAIAVTVGPGTFTGVRLGVAAARGLAVAKELPVWTATSLALVDAEARARGLPGEAVVLAVADARNQQVHVQRFLPGGPSAGPRLMGVAEASGLIDERTWLAGSGARLVAETALANGRACGGVVEGAEPDARHFASIPLERADPPLPLYMRPPDAKPQDGKSLPRAAT